MEPVLGFFASAFISVMVTKLVNKGLTFFPNRKHLKQKLDRLNQLLPTIQSILTAAERRRTYHFTQEQQAQLTELKDAIYLADDVLDNLECKLLERESRKIKLFHGNIGIDMLEKTVDNLQGVVTSFINTFHFLSSEPEHGDQDTRETSSLLPLAGMFGREGEVRQILEMLERGENFQYRSGFGVLSIVGTAGIGKTALAQLIYNHEFVKREFPMRIWVYVSEKFNVRKLTVKMIQRALDGEQLLPRKDYDTLEDAHADLVRLLTGKRFMLVLDDVWEEIYSENWDDLCKPFKLAAKRSVVLLTSQIRSVVKQIETMGQVTLSGLDTDDYWRLFKHCAFGGDDPEEHSNLGKNVGRTSDKVKEKSRLEEIGWEIASRLDGSPLAAKLLGSVLRRNKDEGYWNQIRQSDLWSLGKRDENIIFPSLWLSYKYLNGQLKHCFVYCAVFPQGYILEKDKVVQMWVAQGFIPPSGVERPEDVGNRCFEELIDRSFFRPVWNGKYMMHSLIRELAQSIGSNEFFTFTDWPWGIPSRTACHITARTDDLLQLEHALANNYFNLKHLRTVLFFGGYKDSVRFCGLLDSIFQQVKSIRVLDLSHTCMTELPSSIDNLKHLRYLDLCGNRVRSLPQDLCSLYHLQVLNVKWCPLQQLPEKMNRLINLRHICADIVTISGISQILKLTNLQELENFPAGKSNDLNALACMTELRGVLHIADLHLVKVGEVKEGILKKSKHLTSLWLSWDSEGRGIRQLDDAQTTLDEKVLQCLQPHDNLKELRIDSYVGLRSPTWMLTNNCLSNVRSMYVIGCVNWQNLPPLELLPELEILEIKGMHALEKVSSQSLSHDSVKKGFPRLKKLSIDDLPNLKEWTGVEDGQFFPCLCELVVRNCPTLERFPYIPQLENVILENVGLVSLTAFFNACCPEVSLPESSSSNSKGNPLALPTISSMYISKCPNLRFLGESLNQLFLPRLFELEIRNCPQLCLLPDLPPTLTKLIIEDAGLEELPTIWNEGLTDDFEVVGTGSFLPTLSTLYISSCSKLSTLSIGLFRQQRLLRRLGKLSLRNCENLKSDLAKGFRALTALKELTIFDCPKLLISHFYVSLKTIEISECFITQGAWSDDQNPILQAIETVKIIGCSHANFDEDRKLNPVDSFKHLTSVDHLYLVNTSVLTLDLFTKLHSLRILDIDGCQRFLTKQLQLLHFSKLQHLSIRNCKELPYLPEDLNTLNFLMELCIENCPLITSLPQNGLPPSLERLSIRGCNPLLKQRCLDDNHDFPKISYIAAICIEGEVLKSK
ncbi:putative disease resistance protein RGA3 isoform X1 [Ananas comosus]|uniref:Disease resistance protein RGA3 isoform X1 n=1 Tax=Ananas comosus TaxID=4615 RepID=A0A6P5EIW3_ANACO|nr:putative disease resistance protein RGA3 isoform X1 [Ananas comosus]XP_020081426.1 putative disease resistance protein RGA3 isoform X1 [Ananas comosus]XP_020081428.1 putative disease resistance protein RGA3 isoform X1 [Ananas comosus]XP_020081429.1 putative disease resistance protein RGA3 isoform X1 [Ananas comosus]XP_020081430.1 putative disease resistance protein RGA3 isoform X1 [Ananas comosus]